MKILVADIINSGHAIFHEEGAKVYESISCAIEDRKDVVLSFVGVQRCSTLFLNSAIGNLYLNYPATVIDNLLSYDYSDVNLLKEKISDVRNNALHAADYDQYVDNATA